MSFLVVITSPGTNDAVAMSATATGAKITDMKPTQLKPGVVGEVWLVPDATTVDAVDSLTITAKRGGTTKTVDRTIMIMPMVDERAAEAQPYFDMWIDYLSKSHPELGITKTTKWDATFVSTFLVVSHYAYYSDEWEMKIADGIAQYTCGLRCGPGRPVRVPSSEGERSARCGAGDPRHRSRSRSPPGDRRRRTASDPPR